MTATIELRRNEMSAVDLLRQIDEHARWELGRSAAELKTRIDRIFAGPPPSVVPERWPTPKHVTTWQNWPHRLALALMPDANDAAPVAGQVYDQKRGWVPERPEQVPAALDAEARQRQQTLAGVYERPRQADCGATMPGLFGAVLICVEPAGHGLPHRTADDTQWWPARPPWWRRALAQVEDALRRVGEPR